MIRGYNGYSLIAPASEKTGTCSYFLGAGCVRMISSMAWDVSPDNQT
jgi:hypothetical protein